MHYIRTKRKKLNFHRPVIILSHHSFLKLFGNPPEKRERREKMRTKFVSGDATLSNNQKNNKNTKKKIVTFALVQRIFFIQFDSPTTVASIPPFVWKTLGILFIPLARCFW